MRQHVATSLWFLVMVSAAVAANSSSMTITVDAAEVVGPCDNALWGNIGFDPLYAGLTAPESQPVLRMIRESRAFRYLRCHNYFSDGLPAQNRTYFGCRVYSEDAAGRPRYQWWFLDEVLDRMLAGGMRPIVECDFMPDALAEGEPLRNYGGGLVNTPKDYKKWRDLVFETVRHCEQRYGADEVRQWRWEIWNEPDLERYFIDGRSPARAKQWSPRMVDRFNKMYDHFVDGAVAADPLIKVGGPGLAGNPAFLRPFLDHCVNGANAVTGQKGTRVDFISWHGYGRTPGLLQKNSLFRDIIRREFPSLANVEMQQNEWGQPLRGGGVPAPQPSTYTEFEAAFLCRYVDAMLTVPESSVNLFLRWGQLSAPSGTGWRTLTQNVGGEMMPTPLFHAYTLLGKLGPERVNVKQPEWPATVRAIAARNGPGSTQILLYRFEEDNEEGKGEPVEVTVAIQGLSSAVTEARLYRIDAGHGNFHRAWEKAGKPLRPGEQLARRLQQAAALSATGAVRADGSSADELRFTLVVRPNCLFLLTLNGEYRRDNFPTSPHVERVRKAEDELTGARLLAKNRKLPAAAAALDDLVVRYRDLYVGQAALRGLIDVYENSLIQPDKADSTRIRLLETTIGEDERLLLLEARSIFLKKQNRPSDAKTIDEQIAAIRPRVQRRGPWSP